MTQKENNTLLTSKRLIMSLLIPLNYFCKLHIMYTFCHKGVLFTCFYTHCCLFFCLGAKIIMACRDMERGEAAKKEVIESSGSENVLCMKLDLADSKSIREFAEAINKGQPISSLGICKHLRSLKPHKYNFLMLFCTDEPKLNILVNNAGVMVCPYGKTADGFEMQIGVNHFGKKKNTMQCS